MWFQEPALYANRQTDTRTHGLTLTYMSPYLLRPRRPAYRLRIPVKRRRSRPLASLDVIEGHVYEEGYNSDPEGMIDEFIEEVCLCGHGEERVFSYICALSQVWLGVFVMSMHM